MTHYFFNKQFADSQKGDHYCLRAVIDNLYYWEIEGNKIDHSFTVHRLNAGFLAAKPESQHFLAEIDLSSLKDQLGSFSYFVERAVNGFKSYIMWISPDPQTTEIPWKIS
jgi:hypothetical protein